MTSAEDDDCATGDGLLGIFAVEFAFEFEFEFELGAPFKSVAASTRSSSPSPIGEVFLFFLAIAPQLHASHAISQCEKRYC
jgi:hypothetical protein